MTNMFSSLSVVDAGEKLAEPVTLRVLDLTAEECGGELVRLVANDQVVATVRCAELLLHVLVAGQLVEARDGKVVLEEPPGNLPLDNEMVMKARARLFGSWEMNWMAYNFAHDVALPGSSGAPVGFLMYPQAETADGRLDCLDPDGFKYEIISKETAFPAS